MKYTGQLVGTCGMVLGALDLYQLLRALPGLLARHGILHTPPYVLFPMLIVNGAFCILLLWLGALVWFQPVKATRRLKWVFVGQILYFLFEFVMSDAALLPRSVAEAFSAGFGVGGVGMYLQFFSGFPVWGLVLVLLVLQKESKTALPAGS